MEIHRVCVLYTGRSGGAAVGGRLLAQQAEQAGLGFESGSATASHVALGKCLHVSEPVSSPVKR